MINYKFPYIQNSYVFTNVHIDKIIRFVAGGPHGLLERNVFLEGDSETVCCNVCNDDVPHKRGDFFHRCFL